MTARSPTKPRLVRLTDPIEIESARFNGPNDIIAAEYQGVWWAYSFSVERWRARAQSSPDQ